MNMIDAATVSIIIPVYNTGKDKLQRCLDAAEKGIQNQEPGSEVILVDDGSAEETALFLDQYVSKHPDFICFHQSNRGASAARNTGIINAKGAYLCFVDADDCPNFPDYRDLLLKYANADILITDLEVIYENGKNELWKAFPHTGGAVSIREVLEKLCCDGKLNGPVCKLIKKSFLEKEGMRFPEDMILGEDLCFFLNLLAENPAIYYCDTVTYFYYKNSITGNTRMLEKQDQVFSDYIRMHEKTNEIISLSGCEEDIKTKLYSRNTDRFVKQVFNAFAELELLQQIESKNLDKVNSYLDIYLRSHPEAECDKKTKVKIHLLEKKDYRAIHLYAKARKLYHNLKK